MKHDLKTLLDLFYCMLRIRRIEEAIAARYNEQKMRTPVHLSIGQEAVAVAVGLQLRSHDYAVSTHRAHAHYLAKGGSLKAMIAEIYGKVSGCCRGRGGSMHLIDTAVRFMGSTAIVGNTIPIGVGLGLSIQLDGDDRVSCVFIGDGAIEEGVFFESLNFAVLKNLPVLFICENNRYSVYSPFNKRQPATRNIYDIASSVGAKTYQANGYDLLTCYDLVGEAVEGIRQGRGPCFLEFETYRWREHCGPNYDNDIGYRTEAEYQAWRSKDPVEQFGRYLQQQCEITATQIEEIEKLISKEIEDAFDFAEVSPFPDPIEATTGQYKPKKQSSTQRSEIYELNEVLAVHSA